MELRRKERIMRRILVPLDGSAFAESVIPDARRMAGPDGELILVHDETRDSQGQMNTVAGERSDSDVDAYLAKLVRLLQESGVQAQARTVYFPEVPVGIDEAAAIFGCDMIACATHGRTAAGRLVRGGSAWQAVAGSKVPVLLRHFDHVESVGLEPVKHRHIMVPLDGSKSAEQALPLARQLANEWHASLLLVRVVTYLPERTYAAAAFVVDYEEEVRLNRTYLDRVAGTLGGDVETVVYLGDAVDRLVHATVEKDVTDVVMTSHGRTGLSRVILGSIADELVHRLHLPIVVIPGRALDTSADHGDRDEVTAVPAHA